MEIIFSQHAKAKIEQRKIPMRAVVAVVQSPDFKKAGYNFREELYKKLRKVYLKVVVKYRQGKVIVITAHLVAKVKNK